MYQFIIAAGLLALFITAIVMCFKKSTFGAEEVSPVDNNKATKDTVFIFFAPWCGYCNNAKTEFELAEEMGKGKVKLIDATDKENSELVEKFKVNGFPTIVKADGTKFEKNMARTADNIVNFANEI